jgi:hypothetical protein
MVEPDCLECTYAEKNSLFIEKALGVMTGCNARELTVRVAQGQVEISNLSFAKENEGVYIISAKGDSNGQRQWSIPIYIGITKRSFLQRIKEHIEKGVIQKVLHGEVHFLEAYRPRRQAVVNHLQVAMFPGLRPMIAKLYESIFLDAFNFPLNAQENGEVRSDIMVFNNQEDFDTGSYRALDRALDAFTQAAEALNTLKDPVNGLQIAIFRQMQED